MDFTFRQVTTSWQRSWRFFAVLLVLLLVAGACSSSAQSSDSDDGITLSSEDIARIVKATEIPASGEIPEADAVPAQVISDSDLVLGLSVRDLDVVFERSIETGARKKATELGVELLVLQARQDRAKQSADIDAMIEADVDGIILSPIDPKDAIELAEKAEAAGIPLLAVINQIGPYQEFGQQHVYPGTVAFVTNDDLAMGAHAADIIVDNVAKEGEIKIAVLQGGPTAINTILRTSGFVDRLDQRGGEFEIAVRVPFASVVDGKSACEQIVSSVPDVDVIYSISDDLAAGCINDLSAAELDAIDIVSIGGNSVGLALLDEGKILGTVCQKPSTLGGLALETMAIAVQTGQLDQGLVFHATPKVTRGRNGDCVPQW